MPHSALSDPGSMSMPARQLQGHVDSSVPTHVLTSDWLGFERKPKFAYSVYAPHLTWSEAGPLFANGIAAVGIKTMLYSNPNRQAKGGQLWSNDEATFSHDCNGTRINDPATALWLMNPWSASLQNKWLALAQKDTLTVHYDAIFEDDANDLFQLSAMPCNVSPDKWLAMNVSLARALKFHDFNVFYNGLSILGPGQTVSPTIALNAVSAGGMMENCYVRPGTSNLQPSGQVWQTVENTELLMAAQQRTFFCYADNWQYQSSDPVALQLRYYAYASFLLTYDPGSSVFWEAFLTPSGFRVNPETQVVAEQPLVPAPATIAGLLTTTGVYGREYGACYIGGVSVGRCAAVVNSDAFHSHAFPYTGYGHTMVLTGSGILDGGKVSANGPAPQASMAPLATVVAFQ